MTRDSGVPLLSIGVAASKNTDLPPASLARPPTIDDPQTMKAATMAMALTRSAWLHRFQSDFKSCIGHLWTSAEFAFGLALLKLASRALLEYPPDGGHAVAARGSGARRSERA